jgi:LCP family protein required for cell wall assembly
MLFTTDDSDGAVAEADNRRGVTPPTSHRPAARRRSRRRWWRLIAVTATITAVVVLGGLGVGLWSVLSAANQVSRVDTFRPIPEANRPPAAVSNAKNFLVLGADSDGTGGGRSDSIVLIHLPADRKSAQVISIPRDTWVPVPATANGRGGVNAKINAAYAWGGTSLMVRTVEAFTRVRIDHVAVIDFAGFPRIIDALGGVDITVEKAFTTPARNYSAGLQHMNGLVALDYARQRHPFAAGDFARMRHQRDIIAAMVDAASKNGLLTDPARLANAIRATADAVRVDESLSLFDLVWSLRDLRKGNLTMLTSPSAGTGMVGNQSVVFSNTPVASQLFEAVRTDRMDAWLADHPR